LRPPCFMARTLLKSRGERRSQTPRQRQSFMGDLLNICYDAWAQKPTQFIKNFRSEKMIIAERWASQWIKYINSHDLEAMLLLYAKHIEIRSPFARLYTDTGIVKGHDNLRMYWEEAARRLPNLALSIVELYSGYMTISIHHRDNSGRNTIETMMFDSSDKVILQTACLDRVR
jgi:hypothetical protein